MTSDIGYTSYNFTLRCMFPSLQGYTTKYWWNCGLQKAMHFSRSGRSGVYDILPTSKYQFELGHSVGHEWKSTCKYICFKNYNYHNRFTAGRKGRRGLWKNTCCTRKNKLVPTREIDISSEVSNSFSFRIFVSWNNKLQPRTKNQ